VKICRNCKVEYDDRAECMCPTYRMRMQRSEHSLVPYEWIRDVWGYPLYCDRCKSEYWPSEDCD
jgi:hypothetical protein